MACSLLKKANLLSSIADVATFAISRRGYSAASSTMVRGGRSGAGSVVNQVEEKKVVWMMKDGGAESSSSWVPDPVTGYYRPANQVVEKGAAELREMLLNNHKARQH